MTRRDDLERLLLRRRSALEACWPDRAVWIQGRHLGLRFPEGEIRVGGQRANLHELETLASRLVTHLRRQSDPIEYLRLCQELNDVGRAPPRVSDDPLDPGYVPDWARSR